MNMRVTFTFADEGWADIGAQSLCEEFPGIVVTHEGRTVSHVGPVEDTSNETLMIVENALSLSSEELQSVGIIRVEVTID